MRIFHSKHQKLILQCYPPGKTVDKKPNSSELSYLLYYASTRRIKLEKVAIFLDKKTASDYHRNRAGNMQVTLAILLELIDKCSDDLNVFATYVCSILQTVLTTKDLALCKSALHTYGVFCAKLDGSLFPGNKLFVDLFSLLLESFVSIHDDMAYDKPNPNFLDWRMILLIACRHLSSCVGYDAKFGHKFINKIVPIFLATIHEANSIDLLLAKLNLAYAHTRRYSRDGGGLTKVVLSKSITQINARIDEDLENSTVTPDDINNEAFRGITALFTSSMSGHVSEVTRIVIKYLQAPQYETQWATNFIELFTTWVPVQLRFITVSSLLALLLRVLGETTPKNPRFAEQCQYAQHILGLVSSDINMIGLSILDIIQQLLELETNLVLHQSAYLEKSQVSELAKIYSETICHLSTHIYYLDQVPDLVREILTKINSLLELSYTDPEVTGDKVHSLIVTFLDDIVRIFTVLQNRPSSISRNRVKLEDWEASLAILSPDHYYASSATKDTLTRVRTTNSSSTSSTNTPMKRSTLSISHMNEIQRKYLKVFAGFLENELTEPEVAPVASIELPNGLATRKHSFTLIKKKQSNDYEYNDAPTDEKNLKRPDVLQYISFSNNFFAHLLSCVDIFFSRNDYPNIENVFLLTDTLKLLLNIYGINFFCNFVPFFFHWLLPVKRPVEFLQKNKFKDTIALILMHYSLQTLDEIYVDNLGDYGTRSEFFANVVFNISYRKTHNIWMSGLDSRLLNEDSMANSQKRRNREVYAVDALRKEFAEFIQGNIFLSMWVNPNKPLILDLLKKQEKKRAARLQSVSAESEFADASEEIDPDATFATNGTANGSVNGSANGNGFVNAHGRFLTQLQETSPSDLVLSDDTETFSMRHNHNNGLGLGLGNVNDISSIHSELQYNRFHHPASSIFTETKHVSPKVADLKDINAPELMRRSHAHENASVRSAAAGSILNKQIVSHDIDLILDDLDDGDKFVV